MSEIADKILNKIKNDKLSPRPRWQFWLRDGGHWLGLGLSVLLAVVSIGLLLFFWSDGPWLHGGGLGLGLLLGRMPAIFLGLVLFGIIFSLVDFKNTSRGYRYPLAIIASILVVMVLIGGWLFHYFGFSRGLDRAITHAPYYQSQSQYMVSIWQNPQQGRLTGEIIGIESEDNFTLRDFQGQLWTISNKDAIWRHDLTPTIGLQIKMLGKQFGSYGFEATDIRPFMPMSGGCRQAVDQGTCGMMR